MSVYCLKCCLVLSTICSKFSHFLPVVATVMCVWRLSQRRELLVVVPIRFRSGTRLPVHMYISQLSLVVLPISSLWLCVWLSLSLHCHMSWVLHLVSSFWMSHLAHLI